MDPAAENTDDPYGLEAWKASRLEAAQRKARSDIVKGVLWVAVTLLVANHLWSPFDDLRLILGGERATAVITSTWQEQVDSDAWESGAEYVFETPDGRRYAGVETTDRSLKPEIQEGHELTVEYLPDAPEVNRLFGGATWMDDLLGLRGAWALRFILFCAAVVGIAWAGVQMVWEAVGALRGRVPPDRRER